MNITEGSVKHWLNVASYQNNNNSNGSNGSTSSNNATTTTDEIDQGNSSPQLWDLRWFALLSGPLLFGTIILPLITGPIIRYLCQSYVKLRVYWRLGFSLVAIAYLITTILSYFVAGGGLTQIAFDSACLGFILYQILRTWWGKRRPRIWLLRGTLFLSLSFLAVDLYSGFGGFRFLPFSLIPFGVFGWLAFLASLIIQYHRGGVATSRAGTA